ncbi:MAG: 50S ribosomal protein L10 [Spirochaetota bacterium]|jgi:large subunit ribosomal protein L10|nr:50S ribosomal protein L10 [Spirochaetota bacterium]NMA56633.1 50S ribosomal protein L10 [Treponema sp.]
MSDVKKIQKHKLEAVESTKNLFETYSDYIFTNYRGLTVQQLTELRRQLAKKNAELRVVRNNLARIAFEQMGVDSLGDYFTGPTAIALGNEDANEVAKILFDYAKNAPALEVKGAFLDKEVYDAEKIEAFSKLPGKSQLIAMIMSTINAPVQKLAATLQAYVDKKQEEGEA